MAEESADRNVEMWKIKRLIKSLEMARGYFLNYFYIFIKKYLSSYKI